MSADLGSRRRTLVRTILAFLAVYLIWGSTYLAIRLGVREFSPSALLGLRFLIAGLINLAVWRSLQPQHRPTLEEIKTAAVAGAVMLVGGTGVLAYAERTVPSSTAALIVAASPFWFALGDYLLGGTSLSARQITGILIGFAGVCVLLWPSIGGDAGTGSSWALVLPLGSIAWVSAGLYTKRKAMPRSIFLGAGVEMTAGGVILLILGAALGEYSASSLVHISTHIWAIIFYLALFGSCLAFTSYAWLLEHQPTHRVASYAYVNPVVAVLLGVLLDGDPFSVSVFVALALITLGVTLTMSRSD